MVGYLGGPRLGAIAYNLAHNTALPAMVVALGWWQHESVASALGLIWLAHIGMDRLMGYGLKYNDHFQHTHLGRLGRGAAGEQLPDSPRTARGTAVQPKRLRHRRLDWSQRMRRACPVGTCPTR